MIGKNRWQFKKMIRKILTIEKKKSRWKWIFTWKTLNSTDIKSPFAIYITWQTASQNFWKTVPTSHCSDILASKRAIPKSWSISVLKLETMYCNYRMIQCHFKFKIPHHEISRLSASSEPNCSDSDKWFSSNGNRKSYSMFAILLILVAILFQ